MSIKPILFNTDMVRAILDGRKTVTRRLVKVPPYYPHFYKLHDNADGALSGNKNRLYAGFYNNEQIFYIDGEKHVDAVYYQAPYQPGDILYVRETWCKGKIDFGEEPDGREALYVSQCRGEEDYIHKEYVLRNGIGIDDVIWKPSIHMPKEAARIFLKVKDVRVERLQEITEEQAKAEGIREYSKDGKLWKYAVTDDWWIEYHHKYRKFFAGSWWQDMPRTAKEAFHHLWNSTLGRRDTSEWYANNWSGNPWVWVIEFERCEKPKVT